MQIKRLALESVPCLGPQGAGQEATEIWTRVYLTTRLVSNLNMANTQLPSQVWGAQHLSHPPVYNLEESGTLPLQPGAW